MRGPLLFGVFFFGGLVSANLSGLSSLLNYKDFAAKLVKEALTTFASNLADEGSGDACQHFATFLTKAMIERYEKAEKEDSDSENANSRLNKFMEGVMSEYRKQNLDGLAPVTDECKKSFKVFKKKQQTMTNTKAAIEAVRAFLKALDAKGDPCAAAVNTLAEELMTKDSLASANLATLTGALKNITPKLKGMKMEDSALSGKLPCIKTTTKLFNKYHAKITAIVDIVGSLGILPEGFADGFKKSMEAFLTPKFKEEL